MSETFKNSQMSEFFDVSAGCFIPDFLFGNHPVFYEIDLADRNMNILIGKGSGI